MTFPTEPGDGSTWSELAHYPKDQVEEARWKVAILHDVGTGLPEIRSWLRRAGFSPTAAEELLRELPVTKQEGSWARLFCVVALVVAGLLSVTATVLIRPWEITWHDLLTGQQVHPISAIGFYWCGGLLAFTIIFALSATLIGMLIDTIRAQLRRPRYGRRQQRRSTE